MYGIKHTCKLQKIRGIKRNVQRKIGGCEYDRVENLAKNSAENPRDGFKEKIHEYSFGAFVLRPRRCEDQKPIPPSL